MNTSRDSLCDSFLPHLAKWTRAGTQVWFMSCCGVLWTAYLSRASAATTVVPQPRASAATSTGGHADDIAGATAGAAAAAHAPQPPKQGLVMRHAVTHRGRPVVANSVIHPSRMSGSCSMAAGSVAAGEEPWHVGTSVPGASPPVRMLFPTLV